MLCYTVKESCKRRERYGKESNASAAGILAADGAVVIRSMRAEETDFQQYLQWMTDPETMKYWEGMTVRFTYERVVEEYRENLREQVWPCFMEYEGRAVGYCQFCTLDAAYLIDIRIGV